LHGAVRAADGAHAGEPVIPDDLAEELGELYQRAEPEDLDANPLF
jgi:hypothetical protein